MPWSAHATRERIAELHAQIVWGEADVASAVEVARDLLDDAGAGVASALVRLAVLEPADGEGAIRAALVELVNELAIPTDDSSVVLALVRAVAGRLEGREITVQQAMERIRHLYEHAFDSALSDLYSLCEEHALAVDGTCPGDPSQILEQFRAAILALATHEA